MNRPMPPRKNTVAGNLQQQQQQRPQQSRPQQPRPQQPSSNPRQQQPQQRDYDDGPVMNSEIRSETHLDTIDMCTGRANSITGHNLAASN